MASFNRIIAFAVLLSALLGCTKEEIVSDYADSNALIIKPAGMAKADGVIVTREGAFVYPIQSVFVGGASLIDYPDGEKIGSHRSYFYKEKYDFSLYRREVKPIVEMHGVLYKDVAYSRPGQKVDHILINGIDDSLGLGTSLDIQLNQGVYEGTNELIKDVRFNSYKFSSSSTNHTKDCDIDIIITTSKGDVISIHFANEETPWDGQD